MRKVLPMTLLSFMLGLGLLLGTVQNSQAVTPMPHFNLANAENGEMIDSASFDGKAKLVIFFATW